MPEGDTIHKVANYLAPRLENQVVRRLALADRRAARACEGRVINAVRARGKHLYIDLDNDTALRSHLGMYGAWHRYAGDDDWKKPREQASLVLATDRDVFVCFNAKEIELVASRSVRERILIARLGPDLARPGADIGRAVARAREFADADTLLLDTLLDQRAAAGIGNVYKSEILFLHRQSPATRLADVDDRLLADCYRTASRLLAKNLGGGRRTTRFAKDRAGRLWVYGRTGMPCLRCDGRIASARLGVNHRSTYWCDRCQAC